MQHKAFRSLASSANLRRIYILLADLLMFVTWQARQMWIQLAKSCLQIVPISPVHILCKQGKCVYTLANLACKTVPVFTVHYLCKQGEWVSTFAKTSFSNYDDLQFVHNFSHRFLPLVGEFLPQTPNKNRRENLKIFSPSGARWA